MPAPRTPQPPANFVPQYYPPVLRKPRNPSEAQRLYNHIRTAALLLDALPALLPLPALQDAPVQAGLEPLVAAFVPVLGPFIGAGAGAYVVLLCVLFGVGWAVVGRMLLNLALDMCAGFIPVIGPVIDVTFKCNLANLALLEAHIKRSRWAVIVIPPPQKWFNLRGYWRGRGRGQQGF